MLIISGRVSHDCLCLVGKIIQLVHMKQIFVVTFGLLLGTQLVSAEALTPEKVEKLHQAIEVRKAKEAAMSEVEDPAVKTELSVSADEALWDSVTELFVESEIPEAETFVTPEPVSIKKPNMIDMAIDKIMNLFR